MASVLLRKIHDFAYVLTIPQNVERQAKMRAAFGIDWDLYFFDGVDKQTVSKEQFELEGVYSEEKARQTDRRGKTMTLGHICCSLGHKLIYEDMLEKDFERVLIFEDDALPLDVEERVVAEMIAEIPEDADLIYWGWLGGEDVPKIAPVKKKLYKVQHSLGVLKYNHTMIDNLYPRPFNRHFQIAGKHFCAHAYTVNRRAAEKLVEWQTPVILNADNALMYAVMNGDIKAYIAAPKLFTQSSIDDKENFPSLTAD